MTERYFLFEFPPALIVKVNDDKKTYAEVKAACIEQLLENEIIVDGSSVQFWGTDWFGEEHHDIEID